MSKPLLHPAILALICPSRVEPNARASIAEQAGSTGVTVRTLYRYLIRPWDRWPPHVAIPWCSFCGVDYWKLSTHQQVTPAMLRLTKWDPNDPRINRAISLACESCGVEPTRERIRLIASAFQNTSEGA